MKRSFAALGALLIMGVMVWAGLRRTGAPASALPAAETRVLAADGLPSSERKGVADRIEALLDCARRGDVSGYLSSFAEPLHTCLERLADERGRAAFADELRRTAQARKGHAIFEPEPDGDTFQSARIVVESMFADRIERQTFRVVRNGSSWVVSDVETANEHLPPKPLGSLASFEEPEGVPVPVSARDVPRDDSSEPASGSEND
jgi:hypothetical protein